MLHNEPGSSPPAKFKFCPYCGAEMNPNHKFCGSCGQSLYEGGDEPVREEEGIVVEPTSDKVVLGEQKPSKDKSGILLLVIIMGIMCGCLVNEIGYILTSGAPINLAP